MTKPNWNRLAALEFAGRVLCGRTDIAAGEAQAHADWALQWLGGDLPNSERPPHASGGRIGRATLPPDSVPFLMESTQAALRKKVAELGAAAEVVRHSVLQHRNDDPRDNTPENLEVDRPPLDGYRPRQPLQPIGDRENPVTVSPPRNVPTEGDGSMTVPVYRFYREPDSDPHIPDAFKYWREDTRNTVNVWSVWTTSPSGTAHWASYTLFDDPDHRPVEMTRITAWDLIGAGIQPETRYDTED